jgi:hypothetical protein
MIFSIRQPQPSPPPAPTTPDHTKCVVYRRFAILPTIIGKRFDTEFPNRRLVWLQWYWVRGYYTNTAKYRGWFIVTATGETREEVLPRRASYFTTQTIAGRLFWIFTEMHPALPDLDSQFQYLDMTGIEAPKPKHTKREWYRCHGQPQRVDDMDSQTNIGPRP